jgi:hypothetical protein
VFVHAEQPVNVDFAAARAALVAASGPGWLRRASAAAYDVGLNGPNGVNGEDGLDGADGQDRTDERAGTAAPAGQARVGPRGDVPLMSKLVQVYARDVLIHDRSAVLTLRWEATGYGGGLFPALDADITLTPAGDGASLLTLDGAYRPPLAALGAALDNVILHRVATSTVRSLLSQLAESIGDRAR